MATVLENNSNNDDEDRFWLVVDETIPSLDECYKFVSCDPSCGAVSTFVGITRNNFETKTVRKLTYEGYVPMAIKEMKKLCHDTTVRYPSIRRIVIYHILGDCPIGQPSVIIACSSPHRREAICGSEYLIDELKARIPIWKLEVYDGDESSIWKENIEWDDQDGPQRSWRRVMVKSSSASSSSSLPTNNSTAPIVASSSTTTVTTTSQHCPSAADS